MLFSNKARQEIYSSINDKDKKFACLYGMLLYSKNLSLNGMTFQTESRTAAKLFVELTDSVFNGQIIISVKDNNSYYTCVIDNKNHIETMLYKYGIDCDNRNINFNMLTTSNIGMFTAGIFLVCGSVNDPAKDYHLEFTAPTDTLAEQLRGILGDIGVNAKIRKNTIIVYIKGSESIEDTLTFMNAQSCTLELMDTKINKDIRNKINRLANCDSANIDKVVNAAIKQVEDIRLIERTDGLHSLTDQLRELARLRLDNPVMSLQELGGMLKNPISRSGVSQRFKRLGLIADKLRESADE